MRRTTIFIVGTILGAVVTPIEPLGAQPTDPTDSKVLAEQLFEQGRELVKSHKWAEACPKFEAILRYDNALGARLNLANCYEHIGKLASAWGLYRDSADLARRAGDAKRRDYALKQAAALVPRLAKLTIAKPTQAPAGFTVIRDGVTIDPALLGNAMYVDPGPHEITATAPGFEPFKTSISVAEARSETVVIPEVVPSKSLAGEPQPALRPPAQPQFQARLQSGTSSAMPARLEPPSKPARRKYIAFGAVATGAVMTGVGLFLGASAFSKFGEAKAVCGSLACENDADFDKGRNLIAHARTNATFSTIFVAAGIGAAGTGVMLWLTAPRRSRVETVRILPVITDRDMGVALAGRL